MNAYTRETFRAVRIHFLVLTNECLSFVYVCWLSRSDRGKITPDTESISSRKNSIFHN